MALRNYVQRRNHKERSQPQHRKHLGLLEKHKDYVQRARAHHINRDKLQRLRQKAADRNQDEFYTGMIGKKTQHGVHMSSRGNEAMDNDIVSLLKTQDAGYLRKQLVSERKKYKALVEDIAPRVPGMRLAFLEKKRDLADTLKRANLLDEKAMASKRQERVQGAGTKTKWVDNTEELQAYASKSKSKSEKSSLTQSDKMGEIQLGIKIRELASRQHRLNALSEAAQKLDTVRALMRTRGSHAVSKKKLDEMKDAVSKKGARVTANGLALDENDDDDDDDDDDMHERPKLKYYKWSNERKK